ncbi:MAG: GNAT family N-acetyltransferase [Gemmatimonadaceae bacterium]
MPDIDCVTLALSTPAPSADTGVEVVFLRDPSDHIAASADLFRSPAFFRVHASAWERAWFAAALDASNGRCIASTWFAEAAPGHAYSGVRAPYGGFHASHDPLPIDLCRRVVGAAEDELRARDIHHVTLTLPPAVHDGEAHAQWMNVLLRAGYHPVAPDLSYHLVVSASELDGRMSADNRAMLRGSGRKGLSARPLRESEVAGAFELTAAFRARRGRRMPMSLDALLELGASVPGALHWFGVFAGERLIAASAVLRVSPDALHVLTTGELEGGERTSPAPLLTACMYAWCRDHGIELLDAGIASEAGVPNEDQMQRFHGLGFEMSPRYTLERELPA